MTITKQNSAQTRYIFEAVESIRLARAAELQFEHGNASKLYDTAIHLFIAGVQHDPDKDRQELVRKKLAKCLAKAEKCRSIAANKNTMYVLKHSGKDGEDEGGGPGGGPGGGEFTPGNPGGGDFAPGSMENPIAANLIQNHPEYSIKKSSRWNWPVNLNAYRLSQVLSADIWLVTFNDSEHNNSRREALMLGIPRVNTPSSSHNSPFRSSRSKHDTALSLGLTLRTARKNTKRNRGPYSLYEQRQLTTSQRFLSHEKMLAAIEQEIRTESTIFCLIKSSSDRIKFARKVREVITTAGHPHCQGIGTGTDQCQACKLRASQRNMTLNHSSSSSSNCSSEEDCGNKETDNTIGVSRDLGIIKESRAGSTMIVENDEEEVREGLDIRRNAAVTVIDKDKVKRTQSNNSSSALETSEPDSGKPTSNSSGQKTTQQEGTKPDATFPPKSIIQFHRKHRRTSFNQAKYLRFPSDEMSPPTSGVGSENSSPRSSRCPSSDTDIKNKAAKKSNRKAISEMKEVDLRTPEPVKESDTPEIEPGPSNPNNEALLSHISNIKIN